MTQSSSIRKGSHFVAAVRKPLLRDTGTTICESRLRVKRVLQRFLNLQTLFSRHRLLVLILMTMFAVAGAPRFLRGDLLGGPGGIGSGGPRSLEQSLRSCNSEGTMFAKTENLGEVRTIYLKAMSAVVGEREQIIKTPSTWKCGTGAAGEPLYPELRALADQLPGWHYRVTVPMPVGAVSVPVSRPVTFASFSAIIAELQREYECKLTELQDRNIAEVSRNQDIEKPAQFCCISAGDTSGCREQADASRCLSAFTDDPMCGEACPVLLYVSDLVKRMPVLHEDLLWERKVSRVAVERTLNTLRSFEMNYAAARQLVCYQRASLDLKNEMSLLADAVSCMPKIWDAVTSIHDRKQ